MSDSNPLTPTPDKERATKHLSGLAAGIFIIYAALMGAYLFWRTISDRNLQTTGDFILVGVGAILLATLLYVGGRIILTSIKTQTDIIPAADRKLLEPLISRADEKAIEQYVRLSGLTGITGTATRLGLTGLPLLTVALTLIFSGLELYKPEGGFMDLAKLTLGAFIGSFVQRSATTQAIVSSGGKAPVPSDI